MAESASCPCGQQNTVTQLNLSTNLPFYSQNWDVWSCGSALCSLLIDSGCNVAGKTPGTKGKKINCIVFQH